MAKIQHNSEHNSKRKIRSSGKTGTVSPSRARGAVESVGHKRSSDDRTIKR